MPSNYKPPFPQFRQFFTTSGSESGTSSMVGNFSITEDDFYIQPASDRVYYIGTVLISVSDNTTFAQADFAGIVGGLTNGCVGFIKQGGVETNAFGPSYAIKRNLDWTGVASDLSLYAWSGATNTLSIRFRAFDDTHSYIRLDGRSGDQIGLRVRDNLTGLVEFTAVGRGYLEVEPWSILKN